MATRLVKSGAAQDDTKQGVSLHDIESGVMGDGVGSREHDRLAGGRGWPGALLLEGIGDGLLHHGELGHDGERGGRLHHAGHDGAVGVRGCRQGSELATGGAGLGLDGGEGGSQYHGVVDVMLCGCVVDYDVDVVE